MKQVEFYYDFVCPYAYLASTQVEALASRAGAELVYRPVLLGGLFNLLADSMQRAPSAYAPNQMSPAKARINEQDLARYSALFGSPLKRPAAHPRRTVLALRAALASEDVPKASHALFHAYWGEGADLESAEVVTEALSRAGLDGARAVARSSEPAIKQALTAATSAAFNAGVFGVPSFRVDGEMYWGQDRLGFVARALSPELSGWPPELALDAEPDQVRPAPKFPEIEFWYDFSSPFAHLACSQVPRLERLSGAKVRYKPFLLGALFKHLGITEAPLFSFPQAKQAYVGKDLERHAKAYSVPYAFPAHFPLRSVAPLRFALASEGRIGEVSRALFDAYWGEGQDISAPEILAAIGTKLGLDPSVLQRTESEGVKQALKDLTAEAHQKGLCGAPSFVVGDQVFWGQDRLELAAAAARGE